MNLLLLNCLSGINHFFYSLTNLTIVSQSTKLPNKCSIQTGTFSKQDFQSDLKISNVAKTETTNTHELNVFDSSIQSYLLIFHDF